MRANGGPQVWSLTQFPKHNWGPTTSVWIGWNAIVHYKA